MASTCLSWAKFLPQYRLLTSNVTSNAVNCHSMTCRGLRTVKKRSQASASLTKAEILDNLEDIEEENENSRRIIDHVNQEINTSADKERLFAICHLYGKQYLFSEGDSILVKKYFPAEMGTRVKLEKVMLIGSANFTLLGRPVLDRDLVHVEATLVERTMSHTESRVFHVKRYGGYKRWHFMRYPLSVLRINRIKICHPLNESQSVVH